MRRTQSNKNTINGMELLEQRRLMSAAAFPAVTTAAVTGGIQLDVVVSGGEQVKISQSAGGMQVTCGGVTQSYTGTFVQVLATATTGNNRIVLDNSLTIAAVIEGGAGNDTLIGGGGQDTLYSGKGNDMLVAGMGNNTLVAVGGGMDTLVGGAGVDSIWADATDVVKNVSASEKALGAVHGVTGMSVGVSATPGMASSAASATSAVLADPTINQGGVTYKDFSSNPLFSTAGPQPNDVLQGSLGDCYFVASLAAIAKTDPNQIRQDIVKLADGTYLARLNNGVKNVYEHIDAMLPANSGGGLVYAHLGAGNSVWVAMMEKAFAIFRNNANSYSNIGTGGWMSEAYWDLGLKATNTYFSSSAAAMMTQIQSELNSHQAVSVGVLAVTSGTPLISNHAYSVDSLVLDAGGNITGITVRNPWGTVGVNGYASNNGLVTLTPAQAFANFAGITASWA